MLNAKNAHAAKPRTKCMKNGILGVAEKSRGTVCHHECVSLERDQVAFEYTELRFDRVH